MRFTAWATNMSVEFIRQVRCLDFLVPWDTPAIAGWFLWTGTCHWNSSFWGTPQNSTFKKTYVLRISIYDTSTGKTWRNPSLAFQKNQRKTLHPFLLCGTFSAYHTCINRFIPRVDWRLNRNIRNFLPFFRPSPNTHQAKSTDFNVELEHMEVSSLS